MTDDIGSLSASLKSLATLVQTLDNKLADEKAQRLRLEEKVQQLARAGDDTSGKLSKLEKFTRLEELAKLRSRLHKEAKEKLARCTEHGL